MILPPLPNSDHVKSFDGVILMAYTPSQMQAYGQQCREAALREASEACLDQSIAYKKLTLNTLLSPNGKTLHEGMYGGAYNCAIELKDMK